MHFFWRLDFIDSILNAKFLNGSLIISFGNFKCRAVFKLIPPKFSQ